MLTFSVDHDLLNKSTGILLARRNSIKNSRRHEIFRNSSVANLSIGVHFYKNKFWVICFLSTVDHSEPDGFLSEDKVVTGGLPKYLHWIELWHVNLSPKYQKYIEVTDVNLISYHFTRINLTFYNKTTDTESTCNLSKRWWWWWRKKDFHLVISWATYIILCQKKFIFHRSWLTLSITCVHID